MCLINRNIYGYLCKDETSHAFIYCCSRCELEFASGGDLEAHNINHDDNVQFEMELHESDKSSESSEINEEKKQRQLLFPNDEKKVFSCIICSVKFQRNSSLMRHVDIHIENRPINDCEICGKQVVDLRAHMRTHSDEKPHKCTMCPATFRIGRSMQEHIRKHKNNTKQLICSFCEIVVFSTEDFTRHIAICHKSAPEIALEGNTQIEMQNRMQIASSRLRECVLCGSKVKNLKVHLRSHAQERPFCCPICNKTFTQTGHRNAHIRLHNAEPNLVDIEDQQNLENQYSCVVCCRNFNSIADLDDHMKNNHMTSGRLCKICGQIIAPGVCVSHMRTHTASKQNEKHKCNICPTSFKRKEHLEEHSKFHTETRPYQCSYCTEAFYSSAAFKKHTRISHPEMSLNEQSKSSTKEHTLCTVCGKKINRKNIELHMRVHSGIKPHKCPVCPMAFTQKSNLKNHLRRHDNQKPYHCEQCQKSFHSACALNSHSRRHRPVQLLTCEKCSSTFKSKRSFLNHYNVKHNHERSHKCQICTKIFAWESGLRSHMKKHSEPIYQCMFCEEKFMQKQEKREHERDEHNIP